MNKKTIKIAVYGKGGIGKSTLTSNLSASLALMGKKVLQIGCDPKHDSTRLILNGRPITTVMDYIKNTPPPLQMLSHIMAKGYKGIACIEAGGPEPGVGCAGRGILSAFALLERLGLKEDDFHVIIYDVLGDVVCGGFAVPLRKGFADIVYIITSEEFMSIYAANNILRGIKNFNRGNSIAGIILNSRGENEDKKRVTRFAESSGLPVKYEFPRSRLFGKAENSEKTIVEAFPDSKEASLFFEFAKDVVENKTFFPAKPIDENILETIVLKKKKTSGLSCKYSRNKYPDSKYPLKKHTSNEYSDNEYTRRQPQFPAENKGDKGQSIKNKNRQTPVNAEFLSKSMLFKEPLHGCAFAGAVNTTTGISGSVTIAHGPVSCSYIAFQTILASGIKMARRWNFFSENQLAPALVSTDMDENSVIHGGTGKLSEKLEQVLKSHPEAIFIATTCPAGIIGDDIKAVIDDAAKKYPMIPIIPITTDGNIMGDYMQGVMNACIEGAASLIDPECRPCGDKVNIIAEKNIANNTEKNFRIISDMLSFLKIGINCRFIRNTSVKKLKNFMEAKLCLAAYNDHFARSTIGFLNKKLGIKTAENPFPVGYYQTCTWLDEMGAFFQKQDKADLLKTKYKKIYQRETNKLKPYLRDKKIMIVTYIHDVDWIIETAFDLGIEIAKVCVLNYTQDYIFKTKYKQKFEIETDYPPEKINKDLIKLKPDLLLCNYAPKNLPFPILCDAIPMCPDVGIYGGLSFAGRWASLLKAPVKEGWKNENCA